MNVTSSVSVVQSHAIKKCPHVTQIHFLVETTEFNGKDHFAYCTSLSSVTLPSELRSIPASMFLGCASMTRIEVPATVSSIGPNAFSECSSLGWLRIGPNVTQFGENCFMGIPENLTVQLGEGSSCFKEGGGHLYSANHETVIAFFGTGEIDAHQRLHVPGKGNHERHI